MAKGKKKKKKCSQTDCDNSSTHGTKVHHGQTPDTTDCICLTQPQRRKRLLPCFARKETPPNCPIHSSKDSDVVKKPKSKEKKDTTNKPCFIRRIGRWIVKKVSKGKKEEQIPMQTLEPESETMCVNTGEPPKLQTLCQQALQATTATDNSVEPGSIDRTVDDNVNPETDRNIVISLKELCMAVADNSASKITDISDSKQDVAIDEAQPTEHISNLDNDGYNQITVMSLKDMCKAAIAYHDDSEYNIDDIKTDHTDEQDNNDKYDPELDIVSISSESDGGVLMALIQQCTRVVSNADDKKTTIIDDKDRSNDTELNTKCVTPECDAKKLMSLKDLCTAVVTSGNASTADVIDIENSDCKTKDMNESKQEFAKIKQIQYKDPIEKKTKLNMDDKKPDYDQITVMSLKEMCESALTYSDVLKYDTDATKVHHIDTHDTLDTSDPELDSRSSELDDSVLMSLSQLCAKAVSNSDDKNTTDRDAKDNENDIKLHTKDMNLECDDKRLMSLKDICYAVIKTSNVKTTVVNDAEKSSDFTTECKNTRILSLKNDYNSTTAKQIDDKELCQTNDQHEINLEKELKHDNSTSKSLRKDSAKNDDIDAKHANGDCQQETEKINVGEETKQNIEMKATEEGRDKATKRVNGKKKDTEEVKVMKKMNETNDPAKTNASETGTEYQRGNTTDNYETNMASEDDSQDNNQELLLPVETVYQLMADTYNERRCSSKKNSRNKASLQFEIDYKVNMDGKIIAAEVPKQLHTLTGNMEKQRKRKSNLRGAGKAGKDKKRYNDSRQVSHNLSEQKTGAKLKPYSRSNENESMTLTAVYCDDLVYMSKTTKNTTSNQKPSAVSELVEGQTGTDERHLGAEGQARPDTTVTEPGSPMTVAEPGSPTTVAEPGRPNITTKPGKPSAAAASQKSHRKKKQKHKKAKWY